MFTAISFQSRTESAFATAAPNSRVAINMYRPKVLFPAQTCILFIAFPPFLTPRFESNQAYHQALRRNPQAVSRGGAVFFGICRQMRSFAVLSIAEHATIPEQNAGSPGDRDDRADARRSAT